MHAIQVKRYASKQELCPKGVTSVLGLATRCPYPASTRCEDMPLSSSCLIDMTWINIAIEVDLRSPAKSGAVTPQRTTTTVQVQ